MQRIDTANVTVVDPLAAYATTGSGYGWFTDGTPGVVDGTNFNARWCNQVQEELVNAILDDAGLVAALDVTLETQLALRLAHIKASRSSATDTGSVTPTHLRTVIASTTSRADGAGAACIASTTGRASGALSATLAANVCTASGAQSLVAASLNSDASSTRCAVIACDNCDASTNAINAAIASAGSNATGGAALVAASTTANASGVNSAVVASTTCDASGAKSAVIASEGSTASGADTEIAASKACTNAAAKSAIIAVEDGTIPAGATHSAIVACASAQVHTTGYASLLGGCVNSAISGQGSVLLASTGAELKDSITLAVGYNAAGTSTPTNANRDLTFKLKGTTGDIYYDGAISGAADFAEYFPNAEPGAIPVGSLVAGVGKAVRLAQPGDRVRGIVSAAPALVGNAAALGWDGRFERDEFGGAVLEDHNRVAWPSLDEPNPAHERAVDALGAARRALAALDDDADAKALKSATAAVAKARAALAALPPTLRVRDAFDGLEPLASIPIPDDARRYTVRARKATAGYDASKPYAARSERPEEWTVVGLVGQIRARIDKGAVEGDYLVSGKDGVATTAKTETTRLELLEVVVPFDNARGYGVGLVLVG